MTTSQEHASSGLMLFQTSFRKISLGKLKDEINYYSSIFLSYITQQHLHTEERK